MPFKPGDDLPKPLPPGAHRVISTMTAAQMRKMMEGVVLYGTGKPAQLNGYSSGGKTGTAQKIDPATHTYSKTMHIASFAGFAPVNNPVISVAVVIDTPKGAYYGAAVSAPVFAEVAQQVLEYLGVPHDIDLRPAPPRRPRKNRPLRKTTLRRRARTFRPSMTPPTICPATIRCALRPLPLNAQPPAPAVDCELPMRRRQIPARSRQLPFPAHSSRLRSQRNRSAANRVQSSSPTPGNCAYLRSSGCRCAR